MTSDVKSIIRDHWNGRAADCAEAGGLVMGWGKAVLRLAAALAVTLGMLGAGQDRAAADDGSRVVTDMTGRQVTLPARVTRVIGTGGAVDEWVLLLGSPEKLVGTSDSIKRNPWYARLSPGILRVPTVMGGNTVNIEALIGLKADAAILLSGMPVWEQIAKSGIPTVILERRTPEELMRAVDIAAQVMGPEEEKVAARFRTYYQDNIRRVAARTAVLPPERIVRVYYAAGSPLSTEGRDTLVDSWITLAGGRNMAARDGIDGMGRTVSMEDVIGWNPDVIVTMTPEVRETILHSESWKDIAAVRGGRVFVNPKSAFSWGIRGANEAIQVLWAATAIHPELFPDLDMVRETKLFHHAFYHYDLTDAEADSILHGGPPP